jgi:phage tail sheath protein FI
MAVVTYPGVYVDEVSSGVRPIAAAGTSTAAFVGLAEQGPDDEALRVTSWAEFTRHYGGYVEESKLAESVFQFFNNGGQQCYIVRLTRADAETATVTLFNRADPREQGIEISAKSKGVWGNYLYIQVEDGTTNPGSEFRLSVRRQETVNLIPAEFLNIPALEVYDNLSMNPDAPNYVERVVNPRSSMIQVRVLASNTALQPGPHLGGFNPTLPLHNFRDFQINVNNDGYQLVQLADTIAASEALGDIAAAIQTAVRALTKLKESTPDSAFANFTAEVETVEGLSRLRLTSGATDPNSSVRVLPAESNNATVLLKLGPSGAVVENAFALRRPPVVGAVQVGDNAVTGPVAAVAPGKDGIDALNESAYADKFDLLDNKTDFSLLAVPGFGTPVMVSMGMGYCENRPLRDVFFIGEMDQDADSVEEAITFRSNLTTANSYGAVYFPWVRSLDPSGRSAEPILLPPSGYIAGLYARMDSRRGVWKAPAGTEASLNGVVGLGVNLSDVEQGILNPYPRNINCLRRFPAAGIVSWGARTVTSDPEYQYVPVRRLAIMLRVSIYNGIQWAVFEPNDAELWSQLQLNISSFMRTLYRQGAFQGATPSQAFFVKCDGETTTQDDIDQGIVNVLVGFAPLRPAEFVVVKISQKAGQSS